MICKFEDGYLKSWPCNNKIDPKDFSNREDYVEALENQLYESACETIIEFPDDITVIKTNFMNNCTIHFKGIKISKNIQKIEEGAFWYLDVDVILVDEDNKYFDSRDNCNCVINSKTNKLIFGNIYSKIPDSVVDIDYYSFSSGAFNKDDIKKYAKFDNAYYLGTKSSPYQMLVRAIDDKIEKCLIHPETKIIYIQSFQRCNLLKEITIPGSVCVIGEDAFSSCSQLNIVKISEGVVKIKSRAFGYCNNLRSIALPSTIEELDETCFYGCSSMNEIIYNGNIEQWNNTSFKNDVFVHANIKIIKCNNGEVVNKLSSI